MREKSPGQGRRQPARGHGPEVGKRGKRRARRRDLDRSQTQSVAGFHAPGPVRGQQSGADTYQFGNPAAETPPVAAQLGQHLSGPRIKGDIRSSDYSSYANRFRV